MSKRIVFNQTGDADVLEIIEHTEPAPAAGEVQIKVHAIGLNRADIMYRNGETGVKDFPARLGYEASGEVVAVGGGVAGFAVGDRVASIPAFSFADYAAYGEIVNLPARALVKMSAGQSWVEAAASWMQYITAFGALVAYARLQAGDFVIINAASSSVGVAAIQIANMVGAVPIAVSRSAAKTQELLDAGAKQVIVAAEENLSERVLAITGGKGARVAFDPVGGKGATEILNALSDEGQYYQYGTLSGEPLTVPAWTLIGKRLTLRGYVLFDITQNAQKLAQAKAFITQGLSDGRLKPLIAKVFDFDDVRQAHRLMEQGSQVGKIVLQTHLQQ
ncbi:zinc-dependent alcohol dehydrogenase family protein [Uruburuella testudinis]|uniref:Zinc-dependent alcohol dehydrogenase family protein n=1 Tax=Uruburuella testudinis TaxID=1282863 RepID=A0ABY4E255_9NEIS|nr:zinc-dependent alcohol dehydrogenase family protein [Uruburuella testudinis]UOO83031.1 zinc-dependent alcohol dehydrogenase family protein [Uruburuella testudinis]